MACHSAGNVKARGSLIPDGGRTTIDANEEMVVS
jgi:hypothetical protein